MRRRTLSYQTTLFSLILADLLCAVWAYTGAFFLRIYLGEVSHPLTFLLVTRGLVREAGVGLFRHPP